MEGTAGLPKSIKDERCWRDFTPGRWRTAVDVRESPGGTEVVLTRTLGRDL